MTKRFLDVFLALLLLIIFIIPCFAICIFVKCTSRGPVLYWSKRFSQNNKIFMMPKFRSMRVDTPVVPTHLLENSNQWLTPIGSFLRTTSLDELPQLWSILKGDMSFVGPRPALYNQVDLIEMRTKFGVEQLIPGLTGWAQINGRDELSVSEKVKFDIYYMNRRSLLFDLKIIWLTIHKVIKKDGILH
jgi:O-antigen biosynthesis protein WbqP